MKPRRIEVTAFQASLLSVPTLDPFVIATGRVDATRSVLVQLELVDVETGERASGMGEAAALPPVTREDQPEVLSALESLKLVGSRFDSTHLSELSTLLAESPVARSGVEVALLDALARLDNEPLYAWLGGARPAAAIVTDITVPILSPDRMAILAREWWSRGFRSFKVKVGKDLAFDTNALERMHAAAPEASFRPDANGGFSRAQAMEYVAAAAKIGARLECFEQPCPRDDLEGMAAVRREIDPLVIADESVRTLAELEAVLRAEAADGVNLKIAKSGGLLAAREIGLRAEAEGLELMVGGMVETRLGMTAATHLAASLGGVAFPDLDTAWLLREDPFTGGYEAEGPTYRLPDAPGLGIALVR